MNTDKHATEEIRMNAAETQGSSKSLPALQQVNRNLGSVSMVQSNPTSALRASITPAPSRKGPDLRTTAAFKDIGPATLRTEPNNSRHNRGMIQGTVRKVMQEQAPIGAAPPPHDRGPAVVAKLPGALTQSPRSAVISKSAAESPLSAMMSDRAPRMPNKGPVASSLPPTQNLPRVALLPSQPPQTRPSHGPTQPVGLNPTREEQQPRNNIINNINLTSHEATTIRPQSLGTGSVSQQSLQEAYKPHTSIGCSRSRMPASAVKPRGPSLYPVSQPHFLKTEGLINQQQGSASSARVSGRLQAAPSLRARVSGGIEVTPHMRARVVSRAADPNMLRRDLPGRQIDDAGISQPGVRVKSSNFPLQSRNISSQSPTEGMTGMTATSLPLHMNSLSDSRLRGNVHPSGSGHQSTYHPVHHHLPTRSITSQLNNTRTRPIEPSTLSHPDPSKNYSEMNSQGRFSKRNPIKNHSIKSNLVKPDSDLTEPKSDLIQTESKTNQPESDPIQVESKTNQPGSDPVQLESKTDQHESEHVQQ